MKQAAMAAAAEYTWSNAALQYEAIFKELGVKDILGGVESWYIAYSRKKSIQKLWYYIRSTDLFLVSRAAFCGPCSGLLTFLAS